MAHIDETFNTSPIETQAAISKKIKTRTKKAVEKKNKVLTTLNIEYVHVDTLKPNDYNPNRQSEHDFELLCMSMTEDGFTQPIIALKESKIIVDGEHRWRAARTLGLTEIPVVFADMTLEQMKISTLRHNRARGSEDLGLTADIFKDLQELGALEWAQDSLMMDDVEINRLLEDIAAPEELAGEEYGTAWRPDILGDEDIDRAEAGNTEPFILEEKADGTVHVKAISEKAAGDIREREKIIRKAKTQEERNMATKNSGLYRVSMVFSGEEAIIVKQILGKRPAEKVVSLCSEAIKRMEDVS